MAKRNAGSAKVVKTSTSTTKWLQNAAKSIGLSTKKAFGEYAPNVTDVAVSGTRTARAVVQTIRKTGNVDRITTQLKSNRYVKFMQTAYRNALADIKSGSFNNEERLQNSLFGSADDISEAMDGFSFGDDGAEYDNGGNTINFINASDNTAISTLSRNMENQAKTQIKMQKASMDAYLAVNAASMQQRGELGTQIINQLSNVNNNLAAIVEYQNNNMNQFFEAAMGWMEKTGPRLSGEDDEKSHKTSARDIINNGRGGINLGAYKNYIKDQFKNVAKNSSVGMVAEFLDDDALNMIASNPLGFATDAIVKAAMPKMLKTSLEALDKSFETMVPALLTEIGEWAEDGGMIKSIIGQVFGINLRDKRKSNFSARVEYGAIPFDGETKHAITEVITKELADQTGYLRAIAAKVTHTNADKLEARVRNNREFWDMETNSYIKGQNGIDSIITDKISEAIRNAMGETSFGRGMNQLVEAQRDDKAKKSMQDAVDRLFAAIENSDGRLDANALISIAGSLASTGNRAAFKQITKHIEALNAKDSLNVISANAGRIGANKSIEDLFEEMEKNPSQYHLFNSSYNNDDKEIRERYAEMLAEKQKASKLGRYRKYKGDIESYSTSGGGALFGSMDSAFRSIASGDANGAVLAITQGLTSTLGDVGEELNKTLFGEDGIFSGTKNKFNDIVNDAKMRITGTGYTDAEGNKHELREDEESIYGNLKSIGSSVKNGVMAKLFGKKWNEETGQYESGNESEDGAIVNSITSGFKSGFDKLQTALFGTENPDEVKEKLSSYAKNLFPTAGTGAAVGGGVGILAGSSILGSLIGGPVGGAVLGMATSLVTKSETFQKWFFGEEEFDEQGNSKGRSGGVLDKFVSEDTRKMLSDNKDKLIGAAAIGSISGAITGGGILGTIVGGPIAGAALGMAGTLLAQNDKVKEFLWGKKNGLKIGDKEVDKKGIFGQIGTSIKVDLINPLKTSGKYILKDMKTTLVHEIISPFKIIGKYTAQKIKEKGSGLFKVLFGDNGTNGILGGLAKPFIGVAKFAEKAIGKTISDIGMAAWNVTKRVITFPGKLLAVALSRPIRAINKGINWIGKQVSRGIGGIFKFIRVGLSTVIGKPLKALGKKIAGSTIGRGVRAIGSGIRRGANKVRQGFLSVEDTFDNLLLGSTGLGGELASSRRAARHEHESNRLWLQEQRDKDKDAKLIAKLTGNQFSEFNSDSARMVLDRFGFDAESKITAEEQAELEGLSGYERNKRKQELIKEKEDAFLAAKGFRTKAKDLRSPELEESEKQTGLLEKLVNILEKEFKVKDNGNGEIVPDRDAEREDQPSDEDINDLTDFLLGGGEGYGRRRLHGGAGVLNGVGGLLLRGLKSLKKSSVRKMSNAASALMNRSSRAGSAFSGIMYTGNTRVVDPDATNDRDYNSRMSRRDRNDAAMDRAKDRAHTADELRAEKAAEKAKNPILEVGKEIRDSVKEQSDNWNGIFGKQGLLTAGLIAGFLFLKKHFPGLIDGITNLASTVGGVATGLANMLGGSVAESVEDAAWTSENNALTNGNNVSEEIDRHIAEVKNGNIFTDARGNAKVTTTGTAALTANLAKQWAHRSVKGGLKTGRRIRGLMRVADVAGKGIGKLAKAGGSRLMNGKTVTTLAEGVKATVAKNGRTMYFKGGKPIKAADALITTTKGGMKNSKLYTKVVEAFDKFIATASKKLGKELGEEASKGFFKTFKDGVLKVVKTKWDDACIKIAETLGLKGGAAAVSLGLTEAIFATIGAINGVSGTAKLFQVDSSQVDSRMRVIAAAFGGFAGTTVGSIIDICLSIAAGVTGVNYLNNLATSIYKQWVTKSGDDAAATKLDDAKAAWRDEYNEYQDSEIEKAYEEQKSNGTISSNVTLADFKAGVADGTYQVEYKSFEDWNTQQNASFGDRMISGVGKVVKGLGRGIKTSAGLVAKGAKLYGKYGNPVGLAITAWKNRDKIGELANKAKDSAASILNKAGIDKDAVIDTIKQKGIAGSLATLAGKLTAKAIKSTIKQAWIDQDGCYYIGTSSSKIWTKYTPAGDKIEEIDATVFKQIQATGLLAATDVPSFAETAGVKLVKTGKNLANSAKKFWDNATKKIESLFSASNTTDAATTSKSKGLLASIASFFTDGSGRGGAGIGDTLNGSTYFSQSDPRWGGKAYNMGLDNATMNTTGCGPTAMAMAASDALGGMGINPVSMANLAKAFGDRDETGTNWNFINKASGAMGLRSQQALNPSADYISRQLDTGNPVILSGASGNGGVPYTPAGHYVVAVGKDSNGNVIVNDPRGRSYSGAYNLDAVARKTGSAWTIGGFGRRSRRGGGRQVVDTKGNVTVANSGKVITSTGMSDYQKWITIVRSVKKALAAKQLGYSQGRSTDITVGGKTLSVRTDCSGFVTSCLKFYGVYPDSGNMSSDNYKSATDKSMLSTGFTPRAWNGWDDLQEGDIIGTGGHVEIFARNEGNKHYVYNCGSNSSCNNPEATPSSHKGYTTVWSPGVAGSSCISDFDANSIASDASGSVNYTGTSDATTTGSASSENEGVFSKLLNYVSGAISKATGNIFGNKDTDYSVNSILGSNSTATDTNGTSTDTSASITPEMSATNVDSNNVTKSVWDYFTSQGYSKAATAGIMGNIYAESGFNPAAVQGNGKGPAAGLFQWESISKPGSRYDNMKKYAESKGKQWTDLGSQLEFANNEIKHLGSFWKYAPNMKKAGTVPTTYEEFIKSTDVDKATRQFEGAFERAGKIAMDKRIGAAKGYYETYSNGGSGTGLRRQRRGGGRIVNRGARGGYGSAYVNQVKKLHGGMGLTGYDNYNASKYIDSSLGANSSIEELLLSAVKILSYIASDTAASSNKLDLLKNIGNGSTTITNISGNNTSSSGGSGNGKLLSQNIVRDDKAYDDMARSIAKGGF